MEALIKAEILGASGEVLTTTFHESPLVIGSSASAGLRVQGEGIGGEQLEVSTASSGGFMLRQLDGEHPTLVGALVLSQAEAPSPVSLTVGGIRLKLSWAVDATHDDSIPRIERPPRRRAWSLYAAMIALAGGHEYLFNYTDSPGEEATYLVLTMAFVTLLWAGCWAIGNRLFRYSLAFARHVHVTALFTTVALALAWIEDLLLAAVHVEGLGSLLNWTVWGLWWILFVGAHMAVAGSWSRRRIVVLAGGIYYGLVGLAALVPTDPPPVEQVKLSLQPLGYLPAGMYWGRSSEVVGRDAAELVTKVQELPSERVAGNR